MQNHIKLFACTILIIFIFGCKKDKEVKNCETDCLIFEGTVYDPTHEEYLVSNISIIHYVGNYFPVVSKIDSFQTDADGYYYFSFDGQDYERDIGAFEVVVEKSGYLTVGADFRKVNSDNFDQPINTDFLQRPKAEIEFFLKVPHSNSNGSFKYSYQYTGSPRHFEYSSTSLIENRKFVHDVGGDQNISISYSYKDGVINSAETFYIAAGERKLIEITE